MLLKLRKDFYYPLAYGTHSDLALENLFHPNVIITFNGSKMRKHGK